MCLCEFFMHLLCIFMFINQQIVCMTLYFILFVLFSKKYIAKSEILSAHF